MFNLKRGTLIDPIQERVHFAGFSLTRDEVQRLTVEDAGVKGASLHAEFGYHLFQIWAELPGAETLDKACELIRAEFTALGIEVPLAPKSHDRTIEAAAEPRRNQ